MTAIVDLIVGLLRAIPFFDKWFTKTELEKERDGKQAVDREHNSNESDKRPSEDFWKEHGGP